MKKFSIEEALRFGWNAVTTHFFYFAALTLIVFLIQILIQPHGSVMKDLTASGVITRSDIPGLLLYFVISILGWIITSLITIGLIKLMIDFVDGNKQPITALVSQSHVLLRYIGATVLYLLIVIGGLILLIVPGVIWAFKYSLFSYVLVDKDVSIKEAFKISASMTKGQKWHIFLLLLVSAAVNLLGLIAFGIGLILTVPLTQLALAFVYRKLSLTEPQLISAEAPEQEHVV